jgi:hypothetical protein
MEVHYEGLLSRAEERMRRICAHLVIEFDPAMLSLDKPSEIIGDARGVVGIRIDNKAKYRSKMPPNVLMRIEAITGQVLEECRYELTCDVQPPARIGYVEMRLRQFKDAINLVRSSSKDGGLLRALVFHARYFSTTRG